MNFNLLSQNTLYKIAIIGAGNVAWHLAIALEKAGHRVTEVYSRHLVNAKLLSQQLYEANPTTSLNLVKSQAHVVIIAVSDNALAEVAEKLKVNSIVLVVHTSGTQPLDVLQPLGKNIGVFYPLQTFTKNKQLDFKRIPLCIETQETKHLHLLGELATSLSKEVFVLNSEQRKALHVAAVMACNFTNHLFTAAKQLLDDKDMDFEMLFPLIKETVEKAMLLPPKEAQTGPAKRNDTQIIDKHMVYLQNYPSYAAVYEAMTNSIMEMYKPKV
jgi:predicted short-subunit dehydrogenase-like oxidoreductase (DUF2520 family)